jgi:hypothetical protein
MITPDDMQKYSKFIEE